MSEFIGRNSSGGLTYSYHALLKGKFVIWHRHNFNEILSAFTNDPQHFSVAGFEYQYSPQELELLHAVGKRYQQLGLRRKTRNSATNLPPLGGHVSLSITQARIIYRRIAPIRHNPEFSALWLTVINTATDYAISHNEAMMKPKSQALATVTSLDAFMVALQELAAALPQKDGNSEWLFLLGEPHLLRQNAADFTGYLLLFEVL